MDAFTFPRQTFILRTIQALGRTPHLAEMVGLIRQHTPHPADVRTVHEDYEQLGHNHCRFFAQWERRHSKATPDEIPMLQARYLRWRKLRDEREKQVVAYLAAGVAAYRKLLTKPVADLSCGTSATTFLN